MPTEGRKSVSCSIVFDNNRINIKIHIVLPANKLFFCPRISRIYTNLVLCVLMATCTVAQIFTNSILSAVCDDIRVIRATEQVAILSIEMIRVDS